MQMRSMWWSSDLTSSVGEKRRRRLTFWCFWQIKHSKDPAQSSVDKHSNQILEKKHQYRSNSRPIISGVWKRKFRALWISSIVFVCRQFTVHQPLVGPTPVSEKSETKMYIAQVRAYGSTPDARSIFFWWLYGWNFAIKKTRSKKFV